MAVLHFWALCTCMGLAWLTSVSCAGLRVRMHEKDMELSQVELDVEMPRAIDLVPDLTYYIHCLSFSGFSAGESVWVKGDGTAVTVMETPPPEVDQSVVYSSESFTGNSNEWTLVFQLFEASMVGSYQCLAPDVGDGDANLTIGMSNPAIVAEYHEISALEGFSRPSLAFFYFVSGIPQPEDNQITWYFEDQVVNDSSSPIDITASSFTFPEVVTAGYRGNYACVAETSAGRYVANFTVTIISQPVISLVTSVDSNSLLVGDSITVNCTDMAGYPLPDITWTRGGQEVVDGGTVMIVGTTSTNFSRLTISPLMPGDEGTYRCTGRNSVTSSAFRDIVINVQYKPILEQSTDSTSPLENSTVTLSAEVQANPTNVSFVWKFEEERISNSSKYSLTRSDNRINLTVSRVVSSDSGFYSLEVTNSIGTETVNFTVVVQVPPILVHETSSPFSAIPGSSLTFQFKIFNEPYPAVVLADIEWMDPEGSTIPVDSTSLEDKIASLVLSEVTIESNGTYRAVVNHPSMERSLEFDLIVKYPPLPPSDVQATLTSPCEASISWNASFSNETTAAADYIAFQGRYGNDGAWEDVSDPVDIDLGVIVVPIPGGGFSDSNYTFRGFTESKNFGRRTNQASEPSEPVVAYPRANFPSVTNVSGTPVENPTTIQVSWSVPDSSCFQFDRFQAKCTGGGEIGTDSVSNPEGGGVMAVDVGGLKSDTKYLCEVTSTLSDLVTETVFDHMTVSEEAEAFTLPEVPAPLPELPEASRDKPPSPTTITVQFTLPNSNIAQDVSHYWIVVLRLSSKDTIPPSSPDDLYPADFQFAVASDVNDPSSKETPFLPYIAAELSSVEFNADPTFVIGDEKSTVSAETTYINYPLVSSTAYTCFLRAFPRTIGQDGVTRKRRLSQDQDLVQRQYVVFSSSGFLEPAQATADIDVPPTGGESSSDDSTSIAIGIVVTVFVILVVAIVLILVIVLYLCISKSKKGKMSIPDGSSDPDMVSSIETPDFQTADTPDLAKRESAYEMKAFEERHLDASIPSGPIPAAEFPAHVEKFDAHRQRLFLEEFEWITAKSPWYPSEASNSLANDEKNRYSNVTAFDDTRVRLSVVNGDVCSDYINANFVNGYNGPREYIATQGPLEQTVSDFWRMVWEQGTATIIMLTNVVEAGKAKCYHYWPTNGTELYGGIRVTLVNSVLLPDYTVRSLTVESLTTGSSRIVLQFHYTRWPDYGTPKIAAPLLNFLRAVRESNSVSAGPIVVHCSAGVGRSGTVICIDYCILQCKKEGFVNVRGVVSKMREQRNFMVQTEHQYTFIHYAILEDLVYGDTSYRLSNFSSNYQDLQETNKITGRSLVEEEFIRLGTVRTMVKKSAFVQKVKPRAQNGNPRGFDEDAEMNYSAHYVDSYLQPKVFVVADGPSEEDMSEFWQMLWDDNIAVITMLTPPDAEHYVYWPGSSDVSQHGNIIVKVLEEKTEHLYTVWTIKLTHAKHDTTHQVQLFQFEGWTMEFLPSVPTFVSFVSDVLKVVECFEKNQKLLVHDIESLGPSGVFCALHYCIERLRMENIIDVFQAVQRVQLQRPGMVGTLGQYAFIYDCVYEYIRMHSNSK